LANCHLDELRLATNEFRDNGAPQRTEHHNLVAWDRLAEICAQYLGRGQQVAVEGRLQTRQWDDDLGRRHWKTEVVASAVEMLSGRGKGAMHEAAAIAPDPSAGATS
jgi:single-strand DNA-binding protein